MLSSLAQVSKKTVKAVAQVLHVTNVHCSKNKVNDRVTHLLLLGSGKIDSVTTVAWTG